MLKRDFSTRGCKSGARRLSVLRGGGLWVCNRLPSCCTLKWEQKSLFKRYSQEFVFPSFGRNSGELWGEFLLEPLNLWRKGLDCSEKSWEDFEGFFAIGRLFRSPMTTTVGATRQKHGLPKAWLFFSLRIGTATGSALQSCWGGTSCV